MQSAYPQFTQTLTKRISAPHSKCTSPTIESFITAVKEINKLDPSITTKYLLELPASKLATLQKRLSSIFKKNHSNYLTQQYLNNPIASIVRASGSSREASAWLSAPARGNTKIINEHFAMALRNRLIMTHDQIPDNIICACGQHAKVDKLGIHLQKCRMCYNLTNDTHDYVKLEFAELIRATGYVCRVEPSDLYRADDPDNGNKLDLMIICPDLDTGLIGVDHRVTNAIPADIERGTNTHTPTPGHMIRKSESEKVLKHGKACIKTNITFYAAVNDSQGAWGEMFKKLFNMLIDKLSKVTQTKITTLHNHWTQRLSVALQKGVTRAQLTRLGRLISLNTPATNTNNTPYSISIQETWDKNTQHHLHDDTHNTSLPNTTPPIPKIKHTKTNISPLHSNISPPINTTPLIPQH